MYIILRKHTFSYEIPYVIDAHFLRQSILNPGKDKCFKIVVKYFLKSFQILKHWYFDWGGATISNSIVRKQLCSRFGDCAPFSKSFGHSVQEGALMLSLGLTTTLSTSRRATFDAYRTRLNLDRRRKSRKDGGITMTERCRHLARWISEGRRNFLEHHLIKFGSGTKSVVLFWRVTDQKITSFISETLINVSFTLQYFKSHL